MKLTYAKAPVGKPVVGKKNIKKAVIKKQQFSCPLNQNQCIVKKEGQFDFFTNVISALNHPFYVINADDYSLVFANEAALQGRDIKNLTCYNISHKTNKPCDSVEHGCTLEIVKRTKKPTTLEHTHFDINGKPKNVQVYGYPIFDKKGKVMQMVEYCIDITEKKKIEDKLQKDEARFRALFDNMKGGVAVYEAVDGGNEFIIIDFNKSAEDIDKIKKEKIIGKKITEVFPGVKKFGLFEVLQRVWKTGKPENHPAAFYEDGRIGSWRMNYVYKLPSGEVVALYYDVTEEKRQEDKLRENNVFLKNIIGSLSHPFYVINIKDYSLAIANEAAIQGRDLKGLTCYNISHKTNKPCNNVEHGCTLEIVKKFKKPVALEHIHYDKDGNARYVDVHGYPIFDDKGELVQMIEYCIDNSERKKMELALELRNKLNDNILENAPFGIYIVNEKGNIDYVNEAMIEISGTPKDHFLSLNMFSHEFYKGIGLSEKIKKAMSGEQFRMENIKYTSSFAGKTTVRNFIGLPMDDMGKKKVLMFVEDITDIVKAEEEVKKRNAELEKFNDIAVNRELRMVELKKIIRKLEKNIK